MGDHARPPLQDHVPAERLAEFAEGVLSGAARAETGRHLAACEACRFVLAETVAFLEQERQVESPTSGRYGQNSTIGAFFRRRGPLTAACALAAAAALFVAIRIVRPAWVGGPPGVVRPELAELIAAVNDEPTRPVEGRLSGGFKYAPPRRATRGAGDRAISPDVRVAAARLAASAGVHADADDRAAIGVALIVTGQFDEAIGRLTEAVGSSRGNPRFWNDLAVAYLARGQQSGDAADALGALHATDEAIRIQPDMPEAHFNRALALQALARTDEAANERRRCRELEPDSPWTHEFERRQ